MKKDLATEVFVEKQEPLSNNVENATDSEDIQDILQKEMFNIANDIDKAQNVQTTEEEVFVENTEEEDSEIKDALKKFKNPKQLLKAYEALEREFTKKSQRLKELEKKLAEDAFASEDEWKIAVDKFFEETPSAKPFAKDIARRLCLNPEWKKDKNCLSVALCGVLADKFKSPSELIEDGEFLNEYVFKSKRIRDAIIADYLKGVFEGQPPLTLDGGGMQCVAPSLKPKTIEQAGAMFLKNNK